MSWRVLPQNFRTSGGREDNWELLKNRKWKPKAFCCLGIRGLLYCQGHLGNLIYFILSPKGE